MIDPRALLAGAGALQQFGQFAEYARRIAAGDRRLARRKRDVTRGMGEACHGVDDQQDVFAQIAEIFGDAHRGLRREAAHHRAFVAGRDDGDGAIALLAERVLQEFPHFASALADQRQDRRLSKPRERVSIPSSVDLPMPDPAKMPMRWPAQIGVNRSITRTPVLTGVLTRLRRIGAGGSRSVEIATPPAATARRRRSDGRAH